MESNMFQADIQERVIALYKMQSNKKALVILDVISHFSSDNISGKFLSDLVGGTEELESAVELLKQYSVVKLSQKPLMLSISVPAQEAVRTILKKEKKERAALDKAFFLFQDGIESAGNLSHAVSAWHYALAYSYGDLLEEYSIIPCQIVKELVEYGRYEEAYEFGIKQFKVLSKLKCHCALYLHYKLGNILFKQGKFDEALKMYDVKFDKDANIFLHYAIQDGLLDVTKFLLENKGIDNTVFNRKSFLHYAVESFNLEMVEFLVKRGVDIDSFNITNAARYAIELGQLDILRFLLESGASINSTGGPCRTLVHDAVRFGHFDIAKFLVKSGADFDTYDSEYKTPLLIAAENDNLDLVKLLVKNGADVNLCDNYCRNSLHWAAYVGNLDMVKFLIKRNANVNARDSKRCTPLDYAVEKFDPVTLIDYKGSTQLHYAVYFDHVYLVKKLLKLVKIDQLYDFLDHRTKGGNTAMALAIKANNKTIIKILDNAWQKVPPTV